MKQIPNRPDPASDPGDGQAADGGRRIGQLMIIGFWLLLLALLYLWASRHLAFLNNPNPAPEVSVHQGRQRVELAANRQGHYVTAGTVNGMPVTFLVDTGATSISIPKQLARRLKLEPGPPVTLQTANGRVTAHAVQLDSVAIGTLARQQVRAHINPGLPEGEVLLGMSYLRHFRLTQQRDTLIIEQFE